MISNSSISDVYTEILFIKYKYLYKLSIVSKAKCHLNTIKAGRSSLFCF